MQNTTYKEEVNKMDFTVNFEDEEIRKHLNKQIKDGLSFYLKHEIKQQLLQQYIQSVTSIVLKTMRDEIHQYVKEEVKAMCSIMRMNK